MKLRERDSLASMDMQVLMAKAVITEREVMEAISSTYILKRQDREPQSFSTREKPLKPQQRADPGRVSASMASTLPSKCILIGNKELCTTSSLLRKHRPQRLQRTLRGALRGTCKNTRCTRRPQRNPTCLQLLI
jgi:hypothetical protein